jgi:transcriptional regulator with XRE-family HTH domain
MGVTPGKRLFQARELMGISRSDFAQLTSMKYLRLVTIENERGRMAVDDAELILTHFPELIWWLIMGRPLDAQALSKSGNKHIRLLADNLETHGLPEV